MDELQSRLAVNLITEAFKEAVKAIQSIGGALLPTDLLGTSAQRYADSTQRRYSTVKIVGMQRPVPLEQIYTRVNVLEKILQNEHLSTIDLTEEMDIVQRRFGRITDTKPGLEAVDDF